MRIILAPNALKGSLTAVEAAEAMRRGVIAIKEDCDIRSCPVADGGDGLMDVLLEPLGGKAVEVPVLGPRMVPMSSRLGLVEKEKLAIVEMAEASGLVLLSHKERDPTQTSTYGTGQLIKAALDMGATRIVVGLGGSATCDGGIGMASALGYRFLDENGRELSPVGGSLQRIQTIDSSGLDSRIHKVRLEGLCDVTNPLAGRDGASYVYSPQKGASAAQVRTLDEGLVHLAGLILHRQGVDIMNMAGAGAAGGLGGGLHAFLGGSLKKGIDLVLDIVRLKELLVGADLVLTAEGQIDFQTAFDKAPAGVARLAKEAGVPCFALCGSLGDRVGELHEIGIDAVFSLCRAPQTLEAAMADGAEQLCLATEQVVRAFLASRLSQ